MARTAQPISRSVRVTGRGQDLDRNGVALEETSPFTTSKTLTGLGGDPAVGSAGVEGVVRRAVAVAQNAAPAREIPRPSPGYSALDGLRRIPKETRRRRGGARRHCCAS